MLLIIVYFQRPYPQTIFALIIHERRTTSQILQYGLSYAEKEILYAVEHHHVTILSAETGSGKTTRTNPSIQKCLNSSFKQATPSMIRK